MNRLIMTIALIYLITLNLRAATYYVSLSGSDTYSGTSSTRASGNIGPWRTLTHAGLASTNLQPGDIVYIQAGDYGNENVVFHKSGTAGNPITFQGYKTTPKDRPPVLVENASASTTFNPLDMPTFTGVRVTGTGFNCQNQKYLVFKNFQIRNYTCGFFAGGASQDAGNMILDNVNTMSLGNTAATYSGEGFLFGSMGTKFSNNNTLTNCLVINSAAEGFGINGNYNVLTGCKVYCNENMDYASTDYYILVCGNNNTITNCYIERAEGLTHRGHGIGAKTNAVQVIDNGLALPSIPAQYNKFYYCTAKNVGESFYVRHRTAQYNLFYHCKAIGTHTGLPGSQGGEGNCMVTRDGASSNTFDGCIAENCASGFVFVDSVEDGDTDVNPPGHPGNNNKYINCLIYNCYIGVNFDNYGVQSDAGDNSIANCTFYKTRYLNYAGRHCTKMKYIGNIYYGCLPAVTGGYFKGKDYAADIVSNGTDTYFKQCDFINIQGNMPPGFVGVNGNININPSFVNAADMNLHLNNGSPCIDRVDAISLATNPKDFDGKLHYNGTKSDMGAFEFYSCPEDINKDGIISQVDLSILLLKFGNRCTCPEDINQDGISSQIDLSMLLLKFGDTCGLP